MTKKVQKYLSVLLLFCCFFSVSPSVTLAADINDYAYWLTSSSDSSYYLALTKYTTDFGETYYISNPVCIFIKSASDDKVTYTTGGIFPNRSSEPNYTGYGLGYLDKSTGKLSYDIYQTSSGSIQGTSYTYEARRTTLTYNGNLTSFMSKYQGSGIYMVSHSGGAGSMSEETFKNRVVYAPVVGTPEEGIPDDIFTNTTIPDFEDEFGGGETRGGGAGRQEIDKVTTSTQEKIDSVKDQINNFGGGSASEGAGAGRDTSNQTATDTQNKSDTIKENIIDTSTLASLISSIIDAILAVPSLLVNALGTLFDYLYDLISGIPSAIGELLQSVIDAILFIPTAIIEGIGNMFDYLTDVVLEEIIDILMAIPTYILNCLKTIFVPDTAAIQKEFDGMITELNGVIGINRYDLNNLFVSAVAPSNIDSTYNFGIFTYSGTFVDFSFMSDAVEFFRPYIRGFIVLLLFIFNVRQALALFGLSSGEIKSAAGKGD